MNLYANDLYGISALKDKEKRKDVTLSEVFGDHAKSPIIQDALRKKTANTQSIMENKRKYLSE